MTAQDLIKRFRAQAKDDVEPYFWADDLLLDYLNEALTEAAIRARLIHHFDVVQPIGAGQQDIAMPSRLYEIHAVRLETGGRKTDLPIVSLDGAAAYGEDTPCLIQTDTALRLQPPPEQDGTLLFTGFRLPETLKTLDGTPEIHAVHHVHLIDWLLYKAFSIPDAEVFDPNRAAAAENDFTHYFGLPYQADLKRQTRHDLPQNIKPFWV